MNIIKEAKSAIEFSINFPVLHKATVDGDTAIPGYVFDEINNISFHSENHCIYLADFLLKKLHNSSGLGKQKVVCILSHLVENGHYKFRTYLRQKDEELCSVAAQGTPSDPVLANTVHLFVNSGIQELRCKLFNSNAMKQDELADNSESRSGHINSYGAGYGGYASGNKGQGAAAGFGNSTAQSESFVDQVRDLFDQIISPGQQINELQELQSETQGSYKPISLKNFASHQSNSMGVGSNTESTALKISKSSRKTREYVSGRAGGGWDDEVHPNDTTQVCVGSSEESPGGNPKIADSEVDFINTFVATFVVWPLDFAKFIQCFKSCSQLNEAALLAYIRLVLVRNYSYLMSTDITSITSENEPKDITSATSESEPKAKLNNASTLALLLLLEHIIHCKTFSLSRVRMLTEILQKISSDSSTDKQIKVKARKLTLLLRVLD